MTYKEMVQEARNSGVTSEKTMQKSIDSISALLETLKESHPDVYWKFMREQHEIMYGSHYDKCFAEYDVDNANWTMNQIIEATQSLDFPESVTDWDKYVAFNAGYNMWNKHFDEAQILQMSHDFFFTDSTWEGKVWDYMMSRK